MDTVAPLWTNIDQKIFRFTGDTSLPGHPAPVGLISGVFDLLHVGHVSLVLAASMKCSSLVVAVFNDHSVSLRKGINRPIIDEISRCRLVAALAATSAVVLVSSARLIDLVEKLRPDSYFVNSSTWISDKDLQTIAQHTTLRRLPRLSGTSTTEIIRNIEARYCIE